jgi:hypothetical protein
VRLSQNLKKKIYENLREKASNQSTWIFMRLRVLLFQHLAIKKILLDNHAAMGKLKK